MLKSEVNVESGGQGMVIISMVKFGPSMGFGHQPENFKKRL